MTTPNTQVVTENWHFQAANGLITDINQQQDYFYFFIADHSDHANSQLQPLDDTVQQVVINVYRNMIEGKYIQASDVSLVIPYLPYKSNFVYDMYDDTLDLTELNYYAIVNASSYYHVFKVLDNNLGAQSVYEPNFADISGANTITYQTSDGYVWKYMYTVTSDAVNKFGTSSFFPLIPNTSVSNLAISGGLEVIFIEDTGANYNNYVTGNFLGQDLRIGGNTLVYQISNSIASVVNGFYTGCLLYLNSGTGIGQFANVVDYFSNSNGNFITIDEEFSISPLNGTGYQIYPSVQITGSGSQTANAVAMALVNSLATNSIYKIQMIDFGEEYHFATANIVANSVVGVTKQANLRPIMSPPGGHGYNAAKELGADSVEISITLSNSESNTILTTNKFQQIGILRNPLFANVNIQLTNVVGTFLTSEILYKVNTIRVVNDATVSVNNAIIQANDGIFNVAFSAGDFIYISANSNELNEILVINSVTNSSQLILNTNSAFSSNAATVSMVSIKANSVIQNVISGTSLMITDVNAPIIAGDFVIGAISGATGTVNTVTRNAVVKNYNTFIQLHKYSGVLNSRSFVQNEIVYQGSLSQANGILHSSYVVNGNITIYTSNQMGGFTNTVIGNTSGAVMTVTNKYRGELVHGSGDIIYLENISPITRQNTQNESFQIIMEF